MASETLEIPTHKGRPTELVGGPLCGLKITWKSSKNKAGLKYYGGFAVYQIRCEGKADYVNG